MSRAFVDESAAEGSESQTPELKIPLPAGARNYVTPEGARRLAAELTALLAVAQPRLRETERRIEYLSRMRAIMEVVKPDERPPARVVFGVFVEVDEEGAGSRVYRIVGVDEADPSRGWVSWVSPLARALVGKGPGSSVTIETPGGQKRLTIRGVRSL